MTNKERWNEFTSGLPSPQNYIEWTWRYIVSASLQRRVWLPPDHQPCFANVYMILVGKAGLGKGLCVTKATECIRHWTLKDAIKAMSNGKSEEHKVNSESVVEADLKVAQENELQSVNKQVEIVEPRLIPIAADATTYEALVGSVAKSYRRTPYVAWDEKQQKNRVYSYGHSSICFSLPELGSLLRKRTDDTVNYMLGLYDCPLDYEYNTKHQGKDRVRRGCLNLLAGTTPSFMQRIFDENLIDQGFGSRTFFIYANKDRKIQFFIPELTPEQVAHKNELLSHILKLTTLYGPIKIDKATIDFLENWWAKTGGRNNKSPKLEGYFARKKVHVMKVAMQEHYSESLEMHIPTETFEKAISILDDEEKNMHLAMVIEGNDNPLHKIANRVIDLLQTKSMNFVELMVETFKMADRKQLEEALRFLEETGQIGMDILTDETTKQTVVNYKIK